MTLMRAVYAGTDIEASDEQLASPTRGKGGGGRGRPPALNGQACKMCLAAKYLQGVRCIFFQLCWNWSWRCPCCHIVKKSAEKESSERKMGDVQVS